MLADSREEGDRMKPFIRAFVVVLAFALALGTAGCGTADVAAIVKGEKILISEIETELEAIMTEYPQMFSGADGEAREIDFRQRILENLVNDVLINQAAEEENVDVSEADVDAALEELRGGFPSEAEFEESLKQVGMTVEDLREQIRGQLVTQAIIDMVAGEIEVSDEEVQAYYEENEVQFTETAAVKAAHILFATEDKETAERVLGEINDGADLQEVRDGADFASLAEQYSIDPASAEKGGDLGWPSTPYVPEFQEALDQLEMGEISDLVETVFGWHIITVLDEREERVRTLDEAREEIEQIIRQQRQAEAFQQFVNELTEAAEIEYLVDYAPTV